MKYVAEPGIVLDTLAYTMFCFNQTLILQQGKLSALSNEMINDTFHNFDRFRTGKRKLSPPDELFSMFCVTSESMQHYLMLEYFLQTYDFETCDTEAFFDSMTAESFRAFCYSYYLEDTRADFSVESVLAGDTKSCVSMIALFDDMGKNRLFFIDFICSFDALAATLITYLRACYAKMRAFHSELESLKEKSIEDCVFYEHNIEKLYDVHREENADEVFSICLIDQFTILLKSLHNGTDVFLIGSAFKEGMDRWKNYIDFSMLTVCKALGNDVSYEIVSELRNGEKTVSQLTKSLFLSRSTVDRYLMSLLKQRAICESRKIGVEIYYKLDPDFFRMAKGCLINEIQSILNDIQ
jgi:DNA-binding transcriptional ArsR family regulator